MVTPKIPIEIWDCFRVHVSRHPLKWVIGFGVGPMCILQSSYASAWIWACTFKPNRYQPNIINHNSCFCWVVSADVMPSNAIFYKIKKKIFMWFIYLIKIYSFFCLTFLRVKVHFFFLFVFRNFNFLGMNLLVCHNFFFRINIIKISKL